jgi:hypothetical protein
LVGIMPSGTAARSSRNHSRRQRGSAAAVPPDPIVEHGANLTGQRHAVKAFIPRNMIFRIFRDYQPS